MPRHPVCKVDDISVGKLTPASIGRSPIVLSRLPTGEIRAVSGRCPHQGAALMHGCISGMTDGDCPNVLTFGSLGEILRCPWHGFEFSLVDGSPLIPSSPGAPLQLRVYKVEIEGNDVVVVT